MADSKKKDADIFAGKGSFADRLRRRRKALESGDSSGGRGSNERRRNAQSTDSNN